MITSDSRYSAAAHETALSHLYDAEGNPESYDADGLLQTFASTNSPTDTSRDTTYLLTTAQGADPPRHYMVKDTDNIQLLAYRHLDDPTRWWVIADANPQIRYPFDFVMGKTIHVPE